MNFNIHGNVYNFRGTISLVSADNLAAWDLGGYKALASALRKCQFCMAVSTDMLSKVVIACCSCCFVVVLLFEYLLELLACMCMDVVVVCTNDCVIIINHQQFDQHDSKFTWELAYSDQSGRQVAAA